MGELRPFSGPIPPGCEIGGQSARRAPKLTSRKAISGGRMKMNAPTRYATLAALVAGLACAGNSARTDDTDQSAAAKDTTTTTGRDTLNGQTENPPGYRGMERDTTQAPVGQTPSDTFLQNQGTGTPQDTAGYSGMERDTTGQATQPSQTDTTGVTGQD